MKDLSSEVRLQAKLLQGEAVPEAQWERLVGLSPARKTLVVLQKVRGQLRHGNGTTQSTLEELRRQIRIDLEAWPASLRQNENWVRSTIARRLFADIELDHPIAEESVPVALGNYARNDLILQGVLEQSLASIE